MDERATLCNMATECSAKTGICEPDDATVNWLMERRRGLSEEQIRSSFVLPDLDAQYHGGIHQIHLNDIKPMVAHPGNPNMGIPSDPTNGAYIEDIGEVSIDIAYAGSCTAGKDDDFAYYAKVTEAALNAGIKIADGVDCYIQFGSRAVKEFSEKKAGQRCLKGLGQID